MNAPVVKARRFDISALYPVFALTGVVHSISGPLLPSLSSTFHMNDAQGGLLFFCYYAGTALGALLCRRNYARLIRLGFAAMVPGCLAAAFTPWPLLPAAFLLFGVSVGVPMSAINLYVGRAYAQNAAPALTVLNFVWSAGALAAPLLAAQVLQHHGYRLAYGMLACAAAAAVLACLRVQEPESEEPKRLAGSKSGSFTLLVAFALAAFLQVGVENTASAWLTTYALRTSGESLSMSAASASLYWIGFLASRGAASLLLLRLAPAALFRASITCAIAASLALSLVWSTTIHGIAMLLLGVALAPIYPLLIAGFFARTNDTATTRWIFATAGLGGSVLPWFAGGISALTRNLRLGMLVMPAALVLMVIILALQRMSSTFVRPSEP